MFDKEIPFKVDSYQIIDAPNPDTFEKVARVIDFPSNVTYDPDYLYLWIRIVSAGEAYGPNKNGDYFPLEELLNGYETFREAHPFKNHENKLIEKAIGRIYDVRYNDTMKTVEVFKGIDRKIAPEIVRGFQKGYLTDVSMGCRVPYTVCSVCGNKARRPSEFCNHVKHHKLEFLGSGERVYEINYEPKFHDSSVVLNGAERVAKAFMIIDAPPEGVSPTFKKVAHEMGRSYYVPFTEDEQEKLASYRETVHPLLRQDEIEKVASSSMLQKLAELEKEVTGKIIAMKADETLSSTDRISEVSRIIRFLTDERFDAESLKGIARTIRSLASTSGVELHNVFSTFLGVAELLGITLYPNELNTIIRHATDAHLSEDTATSIPDETEATPVDVSRALDEVSEATKLLPKIDDPSTMLSMYDKATFEPESFASAGTTIRLLPSTDTLSSEAPTRIVEALHDMLAPSLAQRSFHTEHLLPRLAVVMTGNRPLIGGPDVARDVALLRAPRSLGDLLGALSYKSYETMRPRIRVARLVKVADEQLTRLEKTAKTDTIEERYTKTKRQSRGFKDPVKRKLVGTKGVGRLKLMAATLPLAYGASAFFNSKDSNGEQLSSGERFVAEHPGMVGLGTAFVGKPLTGLVGKGINAVDNGVRAGGVGLHNTVQSIKNYANKEASTAFNAFDETAIEKIAGRLNISEENTRLLKVAALFEIGGLEKEAQDLKAAYGIDDNSLDVFTEHVARYVDEEMEKAAGEMASNLLIDAVADTTPLSTSIPGRLVDAFVFKKLMNIGKPKEGEGNEVAGQTPTVEPPAPHVPHREPRQAGQ